MHKHNFSCGGGSEFLQINAFALVLSGYSLCTVFASTFAFLAEVRKKSGKFKFRRNTMDDISLQNQTFEKDTYASLQYITIYRMSYQKLYDS